MSPTSEQELIKMAELSRRSGVPAATIKHYIREGLLPPPRMRTGRTMAYYDPSLVTRIKAIKELQRKRFLPLKVIREVLDGADPYRVEETEQALQRALGKSSTGERRNRRELLAAGMPAEQLDFFRGIGLITPVGDGNEESYSGDDLALLRTLGAARRAGISPEMLPFTIVQPYIEAIRNLVRAELSMFREGVLPHAGGNLAELTEEAARLSEQLVVLIRRKMFLPTLRQLADEESQRNSEARKTPKKRASSGRGSTA